MPIIDIQPDKREMTDLERRDAKIVGVLLSCAKNLQFFAKSIHLSDADAGAQSSVELLACLFKLYDGDGDALERDAILLAGRLGFNVTQMYVGANSGVSH